MIFFFFNLRVSSCGSLSNKSPTDDIIHSTHGSWKIEWWWMVQKSNFFAMIFLRVNCCWFLIMSFLSIIYSFYIWTRIKLYSNWYWFTIHRVGVDDLTVKPFADWWWYLGRDRLYCGKRKSLNFIWNEENKLLLWKLPETLFEHWTSEWVYTVYKSLFAHLPLCWSRWKLNREIHWFWSAHIVHFVFNAVARCSVIHAI